MSLTILSTNAPWEAMRTLGPVTPAVVEFECSSATHLQHYVDSILDAVKERRRSTQFGAGAATLIASAVDEGVESTRMIYVFGDYISVVMDIENIVEDTKPEDIDYSIYYDSEVRVGETVEQMYYDFEEVPKLDWVVIKPHDNSPIKAVLEQCAGWSRDRGVCIGGYPAIHKLCRNFGVKRVNLGDMSTWESGSVRAPALWLVDQLNDLNMHIATFGEDEEGFLHVAIKFDCPLVDYDRTPVLGTIHELEEVLLSGDRVALRGTSWNLRMK